MTDLPLLLEFLLFAIAAGGTAAGGSMLVFAAVEAGLRHRRRYYPRIIGMTGKRGDVVEHHIEAGRRRTRFVLDALELLAIGLIAAAVFIGS